MDELKSWDEHFSTIQTDKQVFKRHIKTTHDSLFLEMFSKAEQHAVGQEAVRCNLVKSSKKSPRSYMFFINMRCSHRPGCEPFPGSFKNRRLKKRLPETKSSPLKNSNGWKMFQHFRGVCRSD